MAVSGYDGMHLIYEALKKTGGSTDGKTLDRGDERHGLGKPARPDVDRSLQTGEVVHNIYIRKVEKVDGELRNVEFATFRQCQGSRASRRNEECRWKSSSSEAASAG